MSQDNKKPQRRRDSILKTRQIVEGEMEEEAAGPVGFKRRVSFRNVKEIQFFNTDTKNCPELLHSAEPLKEKINETLGSDGVITPGRSSTLHSHHSSRNNTIDMFGDRAQKPIPMVQEMHVETLIIEEETDRRINATTHSVIDMDISEVTQAKGEDLDWSNTNPDDTLNVFRPYRPGRQDDSDAAQDANTTMAVFTKGKGEEEPMNDTLDLFKAPPTKEGGEEPLNDTMALFRSPAARNKENMETSPVEPKKKEMREEEELLNATMDIFRGTAARPNTTVRGEVDMEISAVQETMASRTIVGDVSMDITQANITQLNTTADLFRQPQADVASAERPSVEQPSEKKKKHYDPDSTMAVFMSPPASQELPSPAAQPTATTAPMADEPLHTTMDMFRLRRITEIPEPTRSWSVTSEDTTTTPQELMETEESPEPMGTEESPNKDTVETQRKMRLSMYSEPEAPSSKDPLLEAKSQPSIDELTHRPIEGPVDTANMSLASSFGGGDTALRASILSQSWRSRRRSSLGTSMRDNTMQCPHSLLQSSMCQDPNVSIQEQLSFHFRNTLFDSSVVSVKKDLVGQLEPFVEENLKRSKALLDQLLPEVTAKFPGKAAAIETLNCRNLKPFDKDALEAALFNAEAVWFEERERVAAEQTKAARKKIKELEAQIDRAEEDALLCERLELLEAETAELEKKTMEIEQMGSDEGKRLDEEAKQIERELAQLEIEEYTQKAKSLDEEYAFAQEHAKSLHAMLDAHLMLINDTTHGVDAAIQAATRANIE